MISYDSLPSVGRYEFRYAEPQAYFAWTLFLCFSQSDLNDSWYCSGSGGSKLLVRPLLHARKAELVQLCQEQKIPFCTDPTNADTRYIRNRIRKLLSAHPGNKDSSRPMMTSHLRSRTGSMESSQIPSRCFPALSGKERDTGAKRATDAFTVESMARRDDISGVESRSCDPDLVSDLLRLNQVCNIVKAINEQRAIEVVQQMLQKGNEWRQRRAEGQARTQADAEVQNLSATRSAVDMPNFKDGFKGSLLPVPPSSERIAAECAAPGTSTTQGFSLPMPERKDWLSDGTFISLQPLRGCTHSLGVRIVCILFKVSSTCVCHWYPVDADLHRSALASMNHYWRSLSWKNAMQVDKTNN